MGHRNPNAKGTSGRDKVVGPYREDEFDSEFLRTHRSDWASIALRLAMIAAIYWLLARAIRSDQLSAGFVVLPLVVEFLAIFWLGWLLARFVVDCDAFRKSAGSLVLVIFWTLVIGGVTAAMLAWNESAERIDPALIPEQFAAAWSRIRGSGLHYAMAMAIGGLVISTIAEVLRWRRKGGVFVWTSIMNSGFRLGIMILLGFVLGIAGIVLAEGVMSFFPSLYALGWAWAVFAFLLLADVATTVVVALMHRDLGKKSKSSLRGAARSVGKST